MWCAQSERNGPGLRRTMANEIKKGPEVPFKFHIGGEGGITRRTEVLTLGPPPVGMERVPAKRMSLDVDGVGRAVSGDVNDSRVRLGFCKMRNTTRFGVETSGRERLFGRSACDRAVTEVPDAGDHDGG